MTIFSLRAGTVGLFIGVLCAVSTAQVPPVSSTILSDSVERADQWAGIGGYHVARQELEKISFSLLSSGEKNRVLWTLAQCAFHDQEYDDAYEWSGEFLGEYPNDAHHEAALFIRGVSAFQTRRLDQAMSALDAYLAGAGDRPSRGAAMFWRAMCKLDRNDWTGAEADVRHCYEDSLAASYHDVALLGWALSLERRGAYDEAIRLLERFLREFPGSPLVDKARIRLASLSLRRGDPARTAELLRTASPSTHNEQQEVLLLKSESDLQLGRVQAAVADYGRFVEEYFDGPYGRNGLFGLAWARLKSGDRAGAQQAFDSLGTGNDSLALLSLYESGVLALLQQRPNDAMARFDTLTDRSPYDDISERAYFQMGMTRYRSKYYRDARRFFELAARMFPSSPRRAVSFRMMGESNMALGDYSNAQYAFSMVRKLGGSSDILAPSMYQEGVALYHLGRFRSGAEIFAQYLHKFPDDRRAGEGYVWNGEALYQDDRFADAERSYQEALNRFPRNPKRADASYGVAWAQFEEKKFSQAAASFERFSTGFSGDPRALDASLRRADCYYFMGQYDRATALYSSLIAAGSESRNVEYAAFQIAMSYVQRGEIERGIEQLRNFLLRFPNSIYDEVVQFNIGWEYFSREQYDLAVPELRTVLIRYPYSQLLPRVLFNMGDAYYNMKQYDSARVYYERVIKEYPTSLLVPDALNGLQFTYEAEGRPAGAVAAIDTFLTSKTVSAPREELLFRKGSIMFEQNDFAGAVKQYQQVLSASPDPLLKAKTLRELGRCYEMENNPGQAVVYYKQALVSSPDSSVAPSVALALGIAQIKLKQYRDAAFVLENFDTRYHDSPLLAEAQYYRGVAMADIPDKQSALKQFQSMIEQHAGDIFADRSRLQIAQILRDRKEFTPALDTLTGIVNRRGDDVGAEALQQIGQTYLVMKRYKDALQAFNDVIRQYTDFPLTVERARIGLGDAYEKLRDPKRARAAYEEVARSPVDPAAGQDAKERLKRLRR